MTIWFAFVAQDSVRKVSSPLSIFLGRFSSSFSRLLKKPLQGGQTVSIDEMTGIQALERAAPSLPMKPGHVERREFEHIRHGTKALIAALIAAFDVRRCFRQGHRHHR